MEENKQKMSAWTHTSAGPPHAVLSLRDDLPIPSIVSGTQVLVKITHAALNPGPSIMMQFAPAVFRTKPCIPELDYAGVVAKAGQDVPDNLRQPGTEVFGSILVPAHMKGSGALSEYVLADTASGSQVLVLPRGTLPADQGSGVGVAGCVALTLVERANLKPGMRVLVSGAGGGIGTMALQLTRQAVGREGFVVALCSSSHAELMKELGADEVIDRHVHKPVHEHLAKTPAYQNFDVVVDAYGAPELFPASPTFLKETGVYVTVGVAFNSMTYSSMAGALLKMLVNIALPRLLGGTPRRYIQLNVAASIEQMAKLRDTCQQGKMKVVIDSTWDMKDALKAYDKMLSNSAKGKIIVKI